MIQELKPEKLRKKVASASIDWKQIRSKQDLKPLIGQERALTALDFGIGNKSNGFNIYISGYPGSGKLKAVNHFLGQRAALEIPPGDLCYVNNFKDPYCPKKLDLAQGGAKVFKSDIKRLIEETKMALIKAFESKEYADKRQEIIDEFQQKEIELFKDIYKKANESNFVIRRTPIEIVVIPIDENGAPLGNKKFEQLDVKKQEEIQKNQKILKEELLSLLRKNLDMERASNASLLQLEENVALYAIETLLEELLEKYSKFKDVIFYLEDVKNDIISHLNDFLNGSKKTMSFSPQREDTYLKYEVNVITDNTNLKGVPIVMELNPTYNNIFGKVEHEADMGTYVTNFTLIRGGALHQANGGFLILPVKELLLNYFSWESLKRALKNNEVTIENILDQFGYLSTKSLKPDAVPLNVQIILIGSPQLYYLLHEWDEDFKELFKIKAEFDTSMDFSARNIKDFAGVIYKIERENNLLPLHEEAIATLIEQASRMVHDQNKISIQFGEIVNILLEANHYAKTENKLELTADYIKKSIDSRYYRSSLIQEKINEMIKRKTLMIDLSGEKVGQINGISVLDLGDIMFGRPNKITACAASGKEGLIDIEREAELGGPIHTKGVLILLGFLAEKYGQNKAISLFASLVFEQSYSEIEGDSASSAELYAIISSLSQLPIKQAIAVTGSVNQKGEIQPVGAINEKIEGYFEVCRQAGLTGEQGVLIPKANEDNLMLKEDVINEVKEGKFHIWSISSIDEGIEILMGCPAGKLLKNGSFSKNSAHYLVDRRIELLNKNMKNSFGKNDSE